MAPQGYGASCIWAMAKRPVCWIDSMTPISTWSFYCWTNSLTTCLHGWDTGWYHHFLAKNTCRRRLDARYIGRYLFEGTIGSAVAVWSPCCPALSSGGYCVGHCHGIQAHLWCSFQTHTASICANSSRCQDYADTAMGTSRHHRVAQEWSGHKCILQKVSAHILETRGKQWFHVTLCHWLGYRSVWCGGGISICIFFCREMLGPIWGTAILCHGQIAFAEFRSWIASQSHALVTLPWQCNASKHKWRYRWMYGCHSSQQRW
jgi:hypothetical protein